MDSQCLTWYDLVTCIGYYRCMFAKLVAIEGPDKHGKATQSKLLVKSFIDNRNKATLVEVPFKGLTHKVIYWMLANSLAKRFPNVFQFVQFLNKLMFQIFVLPILMLFNDYVVLDRWSLSAIVYGDATGVNKTFNRILYHLLLKPDMTLVMYGRSFKRAGKSDTYEKDTSLQEAVKKGYFMWALEHHKDHEIISNHDTIENVQQLMLCTLAHANITPDVVKATSAK